MQEPGCLENYPPAVVLVSNLVSLLVYGIGIVILLRFSIVPVAVYVFFILVLEYRLISRHCPDCYYYGRTCAFGKGRLSSRFFPRGSPERFSRMQITWKDILPDFLLFLVPVLAGILLLLEKFSLTLLVLVIALLILGFAGNALVRGNLACKYCRQRELGCPAAQLFDKGKDPAHPPCVPEEAKKN